MSGANPSGSVGNWLSLIRRRWGSGAAVFAVVLGAVVLILLLSRPVHRTEARLRLGEPPPSGGVSPTAGILGLWRPGGDPFMNDMELLGSRTVTEEVVEEAALHVEVDAPRGWHRDSLFHALAADRRTDDAEYRLEWRPGGEVRATRRSPTEAVVGVATSGEDLTFEGVTVVPRRWREGMPRSVVITTRSFAEAVRLNRSGLAAERVRREANILDLSFDHTDPGVSGRVVQAWVEGFVRRRSDLLGQETRVTADSLRTRAAEVVSELRAAEEALETFQSRSRLVAPETQGEVFAERFGQARTRLAQARLEREQVRALMARAEAASRPAEAWSELASHPRFVENELVGSLVTRLTELEARRRELALRRTEQNAEHRAVLDEIAELDGMLRGLARGYEAGLDEQIARLEEQIGELDAELAGTPAAAVELGRLQRQVRLLGEIWVATEQRLQQEELREALTFANVQVVDPPALRDRP
ncbi:MAG: GumC family protein, partial [bacterium]